MIPLPWRQWLTGRLRAYAWPSYDCEDCIGMREWGCQCAAYEAIAPGVGPRRRHQVARRYVRLLMRWAYPRPPWWRAPLVLVSTFGDLQSGRLPP